MHWVVRGWISHRGPRAPGRAGAPYRKLQEARAEAGLTFNVAATAPRSPSPDASKTHISAGHCTGMFPPTVIARADAVASELAQTVADVEY
jgi:hypothetical protein